MKSRGGMKLAMFRFHHASGGGASRATDRASGCGSVERRHVPSERNTSSKEPENFESRSRIRNRRAGVRSSGSMDRFLACWVTHAESGCAVEVVRNTRLERKLDERQDVQSLEPDGLDDEEVALDDALAWA
jgi:hypothetical protein